MVVEENIMISIKYKKKENNKLKLKFNQKRILNK